jgi:phosphopantothenoylcysteine decarboxylase/phosphopantothenate--cysteine ligase
MSDALAGKRIVLGVTGSIAAYKAADVASQLGHLGADVHVILTPHAAEFVGAATFRALTRNPVLSDLFDEPYDRQIAHIELAQQVDLILVAPATANLIAKAAGGIADDLLTSTLLAATVPILMAPAMNSAMLDHPATQENLRTTRSRGVELVDPAYGVLACRTEGWGKLAPVETIVQAVVARLSRVPDLAGRRVVVTAGPTREAIDPVRFMSNRSSGKMGYAIAEAAKRRGAEVTLISGPVSLEAPAGMTRVGVVTTDQMLAASREAFGNCDLFIAAAAPADYAPESFSDRKIKKQGGNPVALTLRETPDILRTLAAEKKRQVVVGFAAETNDVLDNARAKMGPKGLDLLVANDVTAEGAGFAVDTNVVTLLWPDGRCESLPLLSKRDVANRILDAALPLLAPTA